MSVQCETFISSSYGCFFHFTIYFFYFLSPLVLVLVHLPLFRWCWCLFIFCSSVSDGGCSSVVLVVVVSGCWSFVFFTSSVFLLVRWLILYQVSGPLPLKLFLLKCSMISCYYDVVAWLIWIMEKLMTIFLSVCWTDGLLRMIMVIVIVFLLIIGI